MSRKTPLTLLRNIGIMAHIDAGKTTTTERILYYTGVSHRMGEVHDGAATMDWMVQEKERGITITSASTTCFWKLDQASKDEFKINIIDTPGHVDFTVEVERSLRILDGTVAVFDAVSGVQPQSETVWKQAEKYKVPRLIFINKMDRTGADFYKAVKSIEDKLGARTLKLQMPILKNGEEFEGLIDLIEMKELKWDEDDQGLTMYKVDIRESLKNEAERAREELIERLGEVNDDIMEKYIEGEEVTNEDLYNSVRKVTIEATAFPITCGTAFKNKGVQALLDAIVRYLPSPIDKGHVRGLHKETGEHIYIEPKDKADFSAIAFKIVTDPHVGRLTYFRIYSGSLSAGSYIYNSCSENKERVGRILQMHANSREERQDAYCGDIVAAIGLKNTKTGDTLVSENKKKMILENIEFPEPVISQAIEPKTKADQDKLNEALIKLQEEDPTFKVVTNEETGQTLIYGMGELHLEIIVDRLLREFKVGANIGKPQVAYKETIKTAIKQEGKFIKQSGGRGQYGHVWLEIEPQEPGKGFRFENKIVGGKVPREYIPAVEKGCKDAMNAGILAGYPMVDIKFTLFEGSYHQVDSSEMAFRAAAVLAVRDGVKKANPILLEPISSIEIITPEEYLGDVIGDLNARRGKVNGINDGKAVKIIDGEVPLSELFGYATTLRSKTQGRATYSMQFSHYEEAPKSISEEILGNKVL
jgi:elongation factor G